MILIVQLLLLVVASVFQFRPTNLWVTVACLWLVLWLGVLVGGPDLASAGLPCVP